MGGQWFLETVASDGSRVRYTVDSFPFRVGRETGNTMAIDALGLSRRHAEFSEDISGRLRVADLNSTNGTFVNRERITGSYLLAENDIIHFGNTEFRLGRLPAERTMLKAPADMRTVVVTPGSALSENFLTFERPLIELISGRGLSGAAQGIFSSQDSALFGYELLGRSTHPDLPNSPLRLFQMAARADMETALSEAFRAHGVATLGPRLTDEALFLNTHPGETFQPRFFGELERMRTQHPSLRVVLEIHETAIMETMKMRELAARLKDLDIRFAYDDFGAGQARLNELGEVPAHFVKFDMGLIREIHQASASKRRVVGDLVRLVNDLGSITLAEGIELEEEAQACRDFGFQLLQGYLLGKPQALDTV